MEKLVSASALKKVTSSIIANLDDKLELFATKDYVDNAVGDANTGESSIDHSVYALKENIPTKTSQITNDSGYLTAIPSEYITETELNSKGYATTSAIPTKTSQLTNNSGYLTSSNVNDYVRRPSAGNNWNNSFVCIPSDGICEMGKYIDFHATNGDSKDYDTRISCSENKTPNTLALPTESGTIATREYGLDGYHIEVLTQAEYDTLITKDPNVLYLIKE